MKATAIGFLVGILVAWQALSTTGVFPELFLPSPILVLGAFNEHMARGVLATAARTFVSFCFGVASAYGAIYVAHVYRKMALADSQFAAARAVPMLAAMPLLIMWFGFGELIRIAVIALSVLAFVAGPLAEATRALPREWTILRQQLGKSYSWEYWHVIMPGTFGAMIGALRVAMAIALTIAIATDFMGSTVGIGRSLDSARVTFNTPAIFLLLMISASIGVAIDAALARSLRRIGHWVGSTSKA